MALSASEVDELLAHVDVHIDDSLARLFNFLRIPSISTEPAYADECRKAAQWLVDELGTLGLDTAIGETEGHPMVTAHARKSGAPHAVFYGHYDVQPVDPLELWHTDPFEPTLKDGRIFARGAVDDKGQVMTFVEACRAFLAVTGHLPIGLSFLVEGEEEAASKSFAPFLTQHADAYRADLALVCDTGMWDPKTPAIVTGLRGIVAEEMIVTCATRDLHSGGYGSAARNPNQVLAELIAGLRNADGGVTIAGFYDDVRETPDDIRKMWDTLDFDEKRFLGDVGLTTAAGEKDRSAFEQINARPTCEINGMSGGYTGEGFKTVIPADARAKISFRLVADQDPEKIRAAFHAHIRKHLPTDCKVEFVDHGAASAIAVPYDGPYMDLAKQALAEEWGRAPVLHGGGGSIPAVESIKQILGLDALMIGFGREDDAVHSPNEKYDLESFHKGIRSWVRILAALA